MTKISRKQAAEMLKKIVIPLSEDSISTAVEQWDELGYIEKSMIDKAYEIYEEKACIVDIYGQQHTIYYAKDVIAMWSYIMKAQLKKEE